LLFNVQLSFEVCFFDFPFYVNPTSILFILRKKTT